MTPTARTLARLRRDGYAAGVVERWIAQAGVRRDLFGCIDLLAIRAGEAVIGVQATAVSCMSARIAKARSIPELRTWLATGARFQVWGWAKVNGRWHPRIVELRAADLEPMVVSRPPRRRRKSRWQAAELFVQAETANGRVP